MADQDIEDQETEEKGSGSTEKGGAGMAKMAIVGVGIFVILVAAQVAVPPLNDMLYGDGGQEVEETEEGEEMAGMDAVDPSELEPAIYTPLDPPLIVSLTDSMGAARFLQLSVHAMSRSQDSIEEIRNHAPALRNSFLFLISDWTYEDLIAQEGKEELRAAMLAEAQSIMMENTGEPSVEELYFTSLVIQ
ncbi:MAG: flagellar basal body-associated FliL family protein [Gammaproteobacteria bacterium]